MTVYLPKTGRTYRYDFMWRGQRYEDTTHQTTLAEARAVEADVKSRLRRQAGGVLRPKDTPRFAEWAGIYYHYVVHDLQLEAPQHVDDTLRVVLRFWGARPGPNSKQKIEADAPYHDLRLADPIEDPDWITKFETWVAARGVSHQQRNHYFSIMSRMYRAALLPKFRKQTGVALNPFAGVPRKRTRARDVTLTVDQIRDWITAASYHVRLATAIAALAPKLRVANVLALEWKKHVDAKLTLLTVHEHKTAHLTGAPLVAPISAQLRRILLDARKRRPDAKFVVTYHDRRVRSIVGGVEAAMTRAGIPYGRDVVGGATFHTIRHSMATLLAELDEADAPRAALMGQDPATTAKYTHLRAVRQRKSAERLSRAVRIDKAVTESRERPPRPSGKSSGPSIALVGKPQQTSASARKRRAS